MTEPVASVRPWQALRMALKKHAGARWGLVWLVVLLFLALLAPLLANSRPLLWQNAAGEISSPALLQLSLVDAVLLGGFFSLLHFSLGRRLRWLALWPALTLLLVAIWGQPQALSVEHQYRTAERLGQGRALLMAPVPYSPSDYFRDYASNSLAPPLETAPHRNWLGTDSGGADVLSRMIHASRIALGIGFVATGVALAIGIAVGACMGYFAGRLDLLGMRLVEIFESIPTLFLLLSCVAFFGRNLYILMLLIGLTSWPGYARYVRAEFLRLRELEFVQAAWLGGLPTWRILLRHMFPNAMSPLLVAASFGMASAILAEATLSFLGLGPVDSASWGQMLNQAVISASFNWWMAAFPGGAIFLTVYAYNVIGEAWREALEPNQ